MCAYLLNLHIVSPYVYTCRYYVYIHASIDVMKADVSRQDSGAQDTGRHTGIIPTYSIVTRVNMGPNRL